MEPRNIERGRAAEQRAQSFLTKNRLHAIASNYRTRFGEIDLVMRDGDTLVFVEVRYRSNSAYGNAAEGISRDKQTRIIHTAHEFLRIHRHDGPVRFDVVTFDGALSESPTWMKNAFEAEW